MDIRKKVYLVNAWAIIVISNLPTLLGSLLGDLKETIQIPLGLGVVFFLAYSLAVVYFLKAFYLVVIRCVEYFLDIGFVCKLLSIEREDKLPEKLYHLLLPSASDQSRKSGEIRGGVVEVSQNIYGEISFFNGVNHSFRLEKTDSSPSEKKLKEFSDRISHWRYRCISRLDSKSPFWVACFEVDSNEVDGTHNVKTHRFGTHVIREKITIPDSKGKNLTIGYRGFYADDAHALGRDSNLNKGEVFFYFKREDMKNKALEFLTQVDAESNLN